MDYREVTIKPKYALRVRDLNDRHLFRCKCFMCDHIGFVPASKIKAKNPEHTFIKDFEHRFKCKNCGFSMRNTWAIVEKKEPKSLYSTPKTPAKS